MRLRLFLTLNALSGVAIGIALLALPGPFLDLLDIAVDRAGIALARLYGAGLVGFGLVTWLLRQARPVSFPVVAGHLANETLTALVLVTAAMEGLGNGLVVALAGLAALFAVGYARLALAVEPA
jgi:hypothetical protein